MPKRKPIVSISGETQELPSTDICSGSKHIVNRSKKGNESVASSTTLQNDDDFSFPCEANLTYAIDGKLRIAAGASSGFKAAFSLPSGATGRFSLVNSTAGGIINDADAATGGGGTTTISATSVTIIYGYIQMGSTAGNVTFQWAQNASNVSATSINRTSKMTLGEE